MMWYRYHSIVFHFCFLFVYIFTQEQKTTALSNLQFQVLSSLSLNNAQDRRFFNFTVVFDRSENMTCFELLVKSFVTHQIIVNFHSRGNLLRILFHQHIKSNKHLTCDCMSLTRTIVNTLMKTRQLMMKASCCEKLRVTYFETWSVKVVNSNLFGLEHFNIGLIVVQ